MRMHPHERPLPNTSYIYMKLSESNNNILPCVFVEALVSSILNNLFIFRKYGDRLCYQTFSMFVTETYAVNQ